MEKEKVRIEDPVTCAGITLVPVVRTRVDCWNSKNIVSFLSYKQPVSLIVISPHSKRAFHLDGEEITLDQLIKEIPDIEEILNNI